jgi:7-keto-8-aminopelargonate synthetase-like enzyme
VGADEVAFKMAMALQSEGVFANVAASPAVPPGKALIRTSYMATHTDQHLDKVLEVFRKVGKALGLI